MRVSKQNPELLFIFIALFTAGSSFADEVAPVIPEDPGVRIKHPVREIEKHFSIDGDKARAMGEEMVKFNQNPTRPRLFPRFKDLSSQFSKEVPQQRGGMCHVYAAADLFEAACSRYLGKRVTVSRSYLIYRHLRAAFSDRASYDLNSEKKLAPHHFFAPSCDGGYCENSLNRIFNGSICTGDEFKAEKRLIDFLETAVDNAKAQRDVGANKAADEAASKALFKGSARTKAIQEVNDSCSAQFPSWICNKMEKIAQEGLGNLGQYVPENGLVAQTADKDLQACIKLDLEGDSIPYTRKDALKFISQGIPFLCGSQYSFLDKYGEVGHTGVVTGYYIANPKTTPEESTIYWQERHATPDENGTHWFSGDCETITVLYKRN